MKRQRNSIQEYPQHTLAGNDPNLDMDLHLCLLKSDQGQHLAPGEGSNSGTTCLTPSSPHHAPSVLSGGDLENQIEAFDFLDDPLNMTLPEALFTPIAHPSPTPDHSPSSSSFPPPNSELTQDAGGAFVHLRTLDESLLVNNLQSPTIPNQRPLQTISRLDYELVITLNHLERETSGISTKTLFDDNRDLSFASTMDQTLTGTRDFVDALKLLVGPQPSMSPTYSNSRGNGSNYGSQRARRNSLSSIEPEYDSSNDSDTHDVHSPDGSRTSSCDQTSRPELDMPSLLSILVVYIRFLRLYLVIFRQIYENLKGLSERGNPQIQLMPVPSISNVLIHSGNLQTVIFIEIVTNLFETMDVLLGLPEEFRMTRGRRGRQGLLDAPDFADLATSILRRAEKTMTTENGKAGTGTRAFRKQVAKLRRLLRERFAP